MYGKFEIQIEGNVYKSWDWFHKGNLKRKQIVSNEGPKIKIKRIANADDVKALRRLSNCIVIECNNYALANKEYK